MGKKASSGKQVSDFITVTFYNLSQEIENNLVFLVLAKAHEVLIFFFASLFIIHQGESFHFVLLDFEIFRDLEYLTEKIVIFNTCIIINSVIVDIIKKNDP